MSKAVTSTTRYVLNNGLTIPVAGFGVYKADKTILKSLVYDAMEVGYRHFDSAQAYRNEQETCEGIAEYLRTHSSSISRSDVFYTTKVGNKRHGYENTKQSIEESLEKAKEIEYIDLFLIHSPFSDRERRLGTWKALQEAVESGKVKSIGLSNYGVHHMEELLNWEGLTVKPVINQVELQPWLHRLDIRNYCEKNNILMEAYSPLTRGEMLIDPHVKQLAQNAGYTPAEILLKWSYEQGFIVLCKTANPDRIESNFKAVDNVQLTDEIRQAFDNPESYKVFTWDPTVYEG